jgi:FHA domain
MKDSRGSTSSYATVRQRWQLRVLNGPGCGTTYAVEARLSIGRAGASDLQLAAQEVSRHHARIVEDEHGRHVLVDLDSSNGTYLDGELVSCRVLEPHAEITIGDVELVYEPVLRVPELVSAAMRPCDVPGPNAAAVPRPVAVARRHAPTTPVGIAVPDGAIRDRDGRAIVFENPSGREYPGNLLADILEYRTLRAQQLRGGFNESSRQVFERLKDQLQQPPSTDARLAQRAFYRFGCWLPARLRLGTGDELRCQVRDVGVDGTQLVSEAHGLSIDAPVCLLVEMIDAGERRSIVLAGRVAWTDREFLGLAFAGAPAREDGVYTQRAVRSSPAAVDDDRTGPQELVTRSPWVATSRTLR